MSKLKKFIVVTLLLLVFIGGSSAQAMAPNKEQLAEVTPEELQVATLQGKEYYLSLVKQYSTEYGVSYQKMVNTINCENRDWDPSLQSKIINSKGVREESYGLSQIHLPSHPSISYKQATDPEFSIKFMAEQFSKGKSGLWTCARKLGY